MSAPSKSSSRWGSLLQQAVAGVEARLDTILAEGEAGPKPTRGPAAPPAPSTPSPPLTTGRPSISFLVTSMITDELDASVSQVRRSRQPQPVRTTVCRSDLPRRSQRSRVYRTRLDVPLQPRFQESTTAMNNNLKAQKARSEPNPPACQNPRRQALSPARHPR